MTQTACSTAVLSPASPPWPLCPGFLLPPPPWGRDSWSPDRPRLPLTSPGPWPCSLFLGAHSTEPLTVWAHLQKQDSGSRASVQAF